MKTRNHVALLAFLAGTLFASSSYAAPADASLSSVTDHSAPASAPPQAKAQAPHKHRVVSNAKLDTCVKEKSADADYLCAHHQDQCAAERTGIHNECEAEFRGERHSG